MKTPLLLRTAKAMYRADPQRTADYDSLTSEQQRRYESMAAAALSLILLEDVPYPIGNIKP